MTNLITAILATYRLTYLLIKDVLPYSSGERLRAFLIRNIDKPVIGELAAIFDCKYCMGVWAAIIVLLLPRPIVKLLAVAGGQYLIETILDKELRE